MPKKRLTTEDFILRAKAVHGGKYDYAKSNYVNTYIPVTIICPIHGEFNQSPSNHLQNHGCDACGGTKTSNWKEFIAKASKIHNGTFDYGRVIYDNDRSKVSIKCGQHGYFSQIARDHLNGQGCPKCGKIRAATARRKTQEQFMLDAKGIHGSKYLYDKVKYESDGKKIIIICPEHGQFLQSPSNHLRGCGCPLCNESYGERAIAKILNNHGCAYSRQHKFEECRNKYCLPFDFYLPSHRMCIEYDGEQHYRPIRGMGGEKKFQKIRTNDRKKAMWCERNGIRLLTISHLQYNNIEEIIGAIPYE